MHSCINGLTCTPCARTVVFAGVSLHVASQRQRRVTQHGRVSNIYFVMYTSKGVYVCARNATKPIRVIPAWKRGGTVCASPFSSLLLALPEVKRRRAFLSRYFMLLCHCSPLYHFIMSAVLLSIENRFHGFVESEEAAWRKFDG